MSRTLSLVSRGWHALKRAADAATFRARLRGPHFVGAGIVLHGQPIVSVAEGSRISIGDRVVLCSDSRKTALGVSHPVILRTLSSTAVLEIGSDTGLSGTTICAHNSVVIGEQVLAGADVVIADTDFHPLAPMNRRFAGIKESRSAAVRIGSNVFLGARSVVLKGVEIGDNSVIGAGSIVAANIPANAVAAGNPCKVIGSVGPTDAR